MKTFPLYCGNCRALIRLPLMAARARAACPSCGVEVEARVFPAAFRQERGRPGEPLVAEGDAGCFYHPGQRAEVHCESCGRFLCGLCDVEFEGKHLCPLCIETGMKKGAMPHLRNSTVNYDSIALMLAVLPSITVYLTLITAPLALFLAIWGWKQPSSLVSTGKTGFVLAIAIAGLEVAVWGVALIYLVIYLAGELLH